MHADPTPVIPPEQPYDYVICLACGLPVRKSMVGKGGHLAVKHDGMTVEEYRAAYPGAIIYSPARLALEAARRKARPELVRARSKRWRDKNPKTVEDNIKNWRKNNLDKVKLQKQRAARKYAKKRRMLSDARTPKQIEEDRRKAREAYARRYPNRSPEKVQKDGERSKAKYKAMRARIAEADDLRAGIEATKQVLADKEAKLAALEAKLGRPRTMMEDQAKYGPRIAELRAQRKSWTQVRSTMNRETGQGRSKSGWRHLLPETRPEPETSM